MSFSFYQRRLFAMHLAVSLGVLCMWSFSTARAAANASSEARNFEGLWWPDESAGTPPSPPPDASDGGPPGVPGQGGDGAGPSADSQFRVVQCAPVQQLLISGGGLAALVFQNERQIVMVAEFGMDFVRTIYLNGRHPPVLEPQINGHSIGHWEGNTLVVDTVGFADKNGKDRGVHIVERITKQGNRFADEITIQEGSQPPRQQTARYELRPEQPFNEYVCEESFDRYQFVNGQLDNPNIPPSRARKSGE